MAWLRGNVPIEVSRVAQVTLGFQVFDDVTGDPINLVGYSILCNIAPADGEAPIANHAPVSSDLTIGAFDILFDGPSYAIEGKQETVILSYQIVAFNDTDKVILCRGSLALTPGI